MPLIRWSLRHRPIVVALAAAFLIWGGWTATRIPLDVLPDLTAPTVTILAEAPGMDPLEIESLVTFPIESALNGAAGVRRVRSATAVGVAVVWVEFDWGQDINRARQTVTEKLTLVSGTLPPGVEPPFLAPVSSIMGEVLFIDLESDRHSPLELRTIAETVVRRRLLAVPGVSQVIATGGEQKQYEVVVDPARLAAHAVTVAEVETALAAANRNATADSRWQRGRSISCAASDASMNVDAIAAVAVKTTNAAPVLIERCRHGARRRGDQARRRLPQREAGGHRRHPEAAGSQYARAHRAHRGDARRHPARAAAGHADPPRSVQAGRLHRAVARQPVQAFIEGAGLVIVVVIVFLMNLRATPITLLALPLSLVAAVIAMDRFGLTINSMRLGGLAIAIGELVDDAIIDVENVVRRLRENAARSETERLPVLAVVYRASAEIRHSVVFATVIVALVFLPLFVLSSVEGRLLRPLGFAYVVALTASLVVALTVTPVLCSWLLPQSRLIASGAEPRLTRRLKACTSGGSNTPSVLARCRGDSGRRCWWRRWAASLTAGRSFLPEFNEGALTVSAVTMPGTSLADSNALGNALERLLLERARSRLHGAPHRASRARRARPGCRVRGDRRPAGDEGAIA